jgi:hypothetical protein
MQNATALFTNVVEIEFYEVRKEKCNKYCN